jgi:hypothetical protein
VLCAAVSKHSVPTLISGNGFVLPWAGTLPTAWSSLSNLVHLDISGTSWQPVVTTGWPTSWSNMTSLRYLDMSSPNATFNATTWPGNRVNGEGPTYCANPRQAAQSQLMHLVDVAPCKVRVASRCPCTPTTRPQLCTFCVCVCCSELALHLAHWIDPAQTPGMLQLPLER